jgi:nicotinamide mononucleotide transporter
MATSLLEQATAMAVPEMVAVLFAVLYLVLAIRQNILCWYCAGISTAIFVYVYYGANLYMESLLNVFYFAMAIYGWHSWRSGGSDDDAMRVSIWPAARHALAISVIIIVSAVSGAWLSAYTDAALPYIDSATTFAAIWATFLVTRKVLENWWYWLVIDVVSVFIYWSRGLELTAILFLFYVVLIPVGLLSWTRSYRASLPAAEAAA